MATSSLPPMPGIAALSSSDENANVSVPIAACVAFLISMMFASVAQGQTDGTKDFIARPKIGAAHFTLPSHLSWQASPDADGTYLVSLSLIVDVGSVLKNIRALSASALNKAKPCGDLLRVSDAAARLTGASTLAYDLSFHFAKRICAGGMPLELPADIACSSVVALSAAGSLLTADVRGATVEPCSIEGTSPGLAKFASSKIFKRHTIDLAQQLPPEFQNISVNVRAIAFDTPPASPHLRIAGDATMSPQQFEAFTAKLDAVGRPSH